MKKVLILLLFSCTTSIAQVTHAYMVSSVTENDFRKVAEDYIYVCFSKYKGAEYLEVKNETSNIGLRGKVLNIRNIDDNIFFTWQLSGISYKALISVTPHEGENIYVLTFSIGNTIYSYSGTEDITDLISLK